MNFAYLISLEENNQTFETDTETYLRDQLAISRATVASKSSEISALKKKIENLEKTNKEYFNRALLASSVAESFRLNNTSLSSQLKTSEAKYDDIALHYVHAMTKHIERDRAYLKLAISQVALCEPSFIRDTKITLSELDDIDSIIRLSCTEYKIELLKNFNLE